MGQRCLFDTCIAEIEVFQLVVVEQVENVEAGRVIVVQGVVFLVVSLLPARVLGREFD